MVMGEMFVIVRLMLGLQYRWTKGLKETHKFDPPSPLQYKISSRSF